MGVLERHVFGPAYTHLIGYYQAKYADENTILYSACARRSLVKRHIKAHNRIPQTLHSIKAAKDSLQSIVRYVSPTEKLCCIRRTIRQFYKVLFEKHAHDNSPSNVTLESLCL
jgi:hypothetical protein